MPVARFEMPDGKIARFEVPEGTTPEQAQALIADALKPAQPVAVSAGKAINRGLSDIPRQIGLTARYGLEGVGDLLNVGTEPVANFMRMAGVPTKSSRQAASALADAIGLPTPETANERVIGDASRMVAGSMGGAGVAQKIGGATSEALQFVGKNAAPVVQSVGQRVAQMLGDKPLQQAASAAGAGLAGGASREGGGSATDQAVASFAGGLVGGFTPDAAKTLVDAGRRALTPKMTPQQIDVQLTSVLNQSGVDFGNLPDHAKNAMRSELQTALQAGKELDPEAVRRLADFASVRGTIPTRGMVTQDPVQITREMNLAKIGANSADGQLQGLARIQNDNNRVLINSLNDAGATRGNPLAAGETVVGTITGRQAALRAAEDQAWNQAKNSPGYRQPVASSVISDVNAALGDEGMMPFLNPTISKYMEAFQTGQPFTPQAYRNLQSMLSNELSKGGNEAAAARIARNALERSELRPITNPNGIDFRNGVVTSDIAGRLRAMDAAPGDAIEAINRARAATRAAYAYEDSSPLVRNVLSGGSSSDPAKIAQRYVIGGTPNEAATLANELGNAGRPVIRDALVNHLKEKALNGAADEVGKFSQSAYNKALRDIGDRKLSMFFSPEEITQLKAVGRVASYMQNQPVGSAVNNSNSGALLFGRGIDLLNKIPVIGPMAGPALQNINVSLQQKAAQNIAPGLLARPDQKPPKLAPLLLPGLAASGGLLSP